MGTRQCRHRGVRGRRALARRLRPSRRRARTRRPGAYPVEPALAGGHGPECRPTRNRRCSCTPSGRSPRRGGFARWTLHLIRARPAPPGSGDGRKREARRGPPGPAPARRDEPGSRPPGCVLRRSPIPDRPARPSSWRARWPASPRARRPARASRWTTRSSNWSGSAPPPVARPPTAPDPRPRLPPGRAAAKARIASAATKPGQRRRTRRSPSGRESWRVGNWYTGLPGGWRRSAPPATGPNAETAAAASPAGVRSPPARQ